ncbi:MAG: EpsG family protein [Flavobacteriaceae bacterium]
MQIFGDYTWEDFTLVHKIVLAFYILFGTFILKLLIGQKQRFIRNDKVILISYIIFLILFAGLREKDIGTDTSNYYNFYFIPTTTQLTSYFEVFKRLNSDFLFEVLMSFSYWHHSYKLFLLSVAIVMNVSLYIFVRKFTNYGKKGSSLILFLTLASSFSFLSIEVNIIRNGLSICFILFGIYSVLEKKYKNFVIYAIVAYLFHRTAIIPIVVILIIKLFERVQIKYYLIFYVLAILGSLAGFGFHAISFLSQIGGDDMAALSYSGDTTYRIGFRPDFVAYNTFFLFLFLKFSTKNTTDSFLIKYYILSSVIFFFNFYIPQSDRFGLFGWVVIPLLLFNTINEKFPKRKIYISTIIVISYFVINNIILFP